MKKTILPLLSFVLFSGAAFAQGFYVKAGFGYAFPQAGQTMSGTGDPYSGTRSNSTYLQSYNLKGVSFSSGLQGSVGVGYMFSPYVGVQLSADAALSGPVSSFHDNNVTVNIGAGPILSNVTVSEQAKTTLVLVPALVLQSGGKKLNIYSRFGAALPLSSKIVQDQVIENAPGTGATSAYDFRFTIKNKFSLGFAAAAGVSYKLNDHMSIWGEASLLSMSLYIKRSDLTDFLYNGQSYGVNSVTSPHTYNYSKNASVDSNGTEQPTYSQPFSNIGIKIGVTFALGSRSGHSRMTDNDAMDNKKPYRRR